MALVTCQDCQAQISDAAPACPKCGRPARPNHHQMQPNYQGGQPMVVRAAYWDAAKSAVAIGSALMVVGLLVCFASGIVGGLMMLVGLFVFIGGRIAQ